MPTELKIHANTPLGTKFVLSGGNSVTLDGTCQTEEDGLEFIFLTDTGDEIRCSPEHFEVHYLPNLVRTMAPAEGYGDEDEYGDRIPPPATAPFPGTQEGLTQAVVNGTIVCVPCGLVEDAQNAMEFLETARKDFVEANENRRQCKDVLENAQEVYNRTTERLLAFKAKEGFPTGSPMGALMNAKST